jgi:hypothetical protein
METICPVLWTLLQIFHRQYNISDDGYSRMNRNQLKSVLKSSVFQDITPCSVLMFTFNGLHGIRSYKSILTEEMKPWTFTRLMLLGSCLVCSSNQLQLRLINTHG